MDPDVSNLMNELRKLERQAKGLIYKMERIETEWNGVKRELTEKGKEITHELGDVLQGWNKKSL